MPWDCIVVNYGYLKRGSSMRDKLSYIGFVLLYILLAAGTLSGAAAMFGPLIACRKEEVKPCSDQVHILSGVGGSQHSAKCLPGQTLTVKEQGGHGGNIIVCTCPVVKP